VANLYLLDRPLGESGIDLALEDQAAKVVLIQDGVYLDSGRLHAAGVEVYAVGSDVERRGQAFRLPGFVRVIDYGQLVDLIAAHKVVNFA
jgi:sulfur relay protein TusB/DsrH